MRTTSLISLTALLALAGVSAQAADLTKIDRSISKEPAYQGKPRYCLLVFGPEANTRVWVVVDGDALYVDRNGNGNLAEPGERVGRRKVEAPDGVAHLYDPVTVPAADGASPPELHMNAHADGFDVMVEGKYRQTAGPIPFGEDRAKAPVLHFRGPLRFALAPRTVVDRSERKLRVRLETPGGGESAVVRVPPCKVPKGLGPVADFEFPNKVAGGPAVKVRVPLAREPGA
jgi:hypothetical protein